MCLCVFQLVGKFSGYSLKINKLEKIRCETRGILVDGLSLLQQPKDTLYPISGPFLDTSSAKFVPGGLDDRSLLLCHALCELIRPFKAASSATHLRRDDHLRSICAQDCVVALQSSKTSSILCPAICTLSYISAMT